MIPFEGSVVSHTLLQATKLLTSLCVPQGSLMPSPSRYNFHLLLYHLHLYHICDDTCPLHVPVLWHISLTGPMHFPKGGHVSHCATMADRATGSCEPVSFTSILYEIDWSFLSWFCCKICSPQKAFVGCYLVVNAVFCWFSVVMFYWIVHSCNFIHRFTLSDYSSHAHTLVGVTLLKLSVALSCINWQLSTVNHLCGVLFWITVGGGGVPRPQSHRRSRLANLPSVGAVP